MVSDVETTWLHGSLKNSGFEEKLSAVWSQMKKPDAGEKLGRGAWGYSTGCEVCSIEDPRRMGSGNSG